jgi:hypothetical protein
MIWALLCGLTLAEDTDLDQARTELSALIAETEDPALEQQLLSIFAHLVAAQGPPAPEPTPVPAPVVASAGPAPTAGPACTLQEFDDLRKSVEEQAFSRDKIALVEKASSRLHFNVEQVVGLLDELDFGSDKVEAAAILHPKLVDPQDFDQVYDALPFDTDRQALKALVEETEGD